jgi:RNA polymerase sigma-70 factor (ECF subfamily)
MDGDVEFVRELFHASYRRLVGQLAAVTGSHAEAEDVVQEAFVRAVDRARALRRADNPEAGLSRGRAALTELVSEHVDHTHGEGVNRG